MTDSRMKAAGPLTEKIKLSPTSGKTCDLRNTVDQGVIFEPADAGAIGQWEDSQKSGREDGPVRTLLYLSLDHFEDI